MTKTTAWKNYRTLSATHSYIIGFTYNDTVYMTKLTRFPSACISYEKASRGQGYGLRLRIRADYRNALLAKGKAIAIGNVDDLNAGIYNKGENFERLVSEYYGIEWYKDTIPFTVGGDICVNGEEIQIKFDGATFATEKTLKLQRKGA